MSDYKTHKYNLTLRGLEDILGSHPLMQGFELDIGVNAIPTINIYILPKKYDGPKDGKPATEASVMDYDEYTRIYRKLSDEAARKDREIELVRIELDIENEETREILELKKWKFTDVSMDAITRYAAPTMVLIISHPACVLDNVGTVYESRQCPIKLESFTSGTVVEILDKLHSEELDDEKFYKLPSEKNGGPDENAKKIVKQARQKLQELKVQKYIDDQAGQFMEGDKRFPPAVAIMAQPTAFGESVWLKLINTLCPEMMMQVTPRYDEERLRLEALNPWKECDTWLDMSKIESITASVIDPYPLIGIAIDKGVDHNFRYRGATRTPSDGTDATDTENEEACSFGFYFPEKLTELMSQDHMPGFISHFGGSNIIDYADSYGPKEKNVRKITEKESSMTDEDWSKFMRKMAEAMFLTMYRQKCTAVISSVLTFKDKLGNTVYPGSVVGIYTEDEKLKTSEGLGKESLFYGYLVRMLIVGSANSAPTVKYTLTNVRPMKAEKILIDDGAKNPCWE